MVLNDRKSRILNAIIEDYIATAEPIGSRTIAKKYDFGISSATIRNEMSDLEELGLIVQPHASAGRVPSDKGYRLFVDNMMKHRQLNSNEYGFLKQLVSKNINQLDFLMKETAKAIALMTNYTTIVSEPVSKKTKIKRVQLVPVDEKTILLVLVTEATAVKNKIIKVDCSPSENVLNAISTICTNNLKELSLEEISQDVVKNILFSFKDIKLLLTQILEEIISILKVENDLQIYTSGVKNFLEFPEFSDLDKARGVFQALEEQEVLITLLDDTSSSNVQIVIGSENKLVELKDCSIIKANYNIDNRAYGSIGIIGPTRMDYTQVVGVLDNIVKNINSVIKALPDNEKS